MRNIWKRTAAAVLALVLCLSLAGCYNENNTWAARKGDDTMPIGGYIYYLYSAYSEAMQKVATARTRTRTWRTPPCWTPKSTGWTPPSGSPTGR